MKLILAVCIIGLIVINLIGLTLFVRRYIQNYTIAKAVGILGLCLPLFFIEHFIGLGSFHWLWPITTGASCWIIYQNQNEFKTNLWKPELIFLLGFIYAALWRFLYPDIHPSSENVPDALYIVNYLPGEKLPSMDYWWPQRLFNWYYPFQHYCAALLGRLFNLNAGQCYTFGFCIISGLIISCAWLFVSTFLQSRVLRCLVMTAFVFGGTGVTPLFMFSSFDDKIHSDEKVGAGLNLIASNRFSGSYDLQLTNPRVRQFFNLDSIEEQRELSVERFSYLFFVKDYHPPLSGLFLLMLALACIAQIEKAKRNDILQAVLVATGPISIAANIWSFPLQVILIVGWIAHRLLNKQPLNWVMLIGGGAFSLAGVYPYLLTLASHSTETPIAFVKEIDHTPFNKYIAQHWPILIFMIMGLFNKQYRKLTMALSITFAFLFFATEMIYLNDLYGGKYERANSTMKWWSWIWDGSVVALGALLLTSQQKIIRYITIFTLSMLSLYLFEILLYLTFTYGEMTKEGNPLKPTFLQLSGDGVRKREAGYTDMIAFLNNAPNGIILENQTSPAYTWTTTMGIYTQKPVMLGWPAHMSGYRGETATYAWRTYDALRLFYDGKKPDARQWLKYHNVKYIIWGVAEDKVKDAYTNINNTIKDDYDWFPFYRDAANQAGIWIRK